MSRLVLQRHLYSKDFFLVKKYIYFLGYKKLYILYKQIITAMNTESFPQITLTSHQSSSL